MFKNKEVGHLDLFPENSFCIYLIDFQLINITQKRQKRNKVFDWNPL